MITIHKYLIDNEVAVIQLPEHAEILCAKAQEGRIYIWVKHDRGNQRENRTFKTYMTGQDISMYDAMSLKYIGTDMIDGLVFHVFESTYNNPK